jgi:hypothetical protein
MVKLRRMRWEENVARMGETKNTYRVLVGNPERKGPRRRTRRKWEGSITKDLSETG